MAASMNWCKNLSKHKLFENLQVNLNQSLCTTTEKLNKSLITLFDNELYVYNSTDRNILCTNLRSLTSETSQCGITNVQNEQEMDMSVFYSAEQYQKLLPTNSPVHEIERILFNYCGTLLALIGNKGISVVTLPQRWGKYAQYEGGKEKVLCSTCLVGERLFVSNIKLQVHQAEWYPGSSGDCHLAVLTSDNYLRIFNVKDPEEAEQSIFLGDKNLQDELNYSQTTINTTGVLGETAVSFDFGQPVKLQKKVKASQDLAEESTSLSENAWPVYILRGSGDVCLLYTTLHLASALQTQVSCPLSMYPPAEDNYGTDACAIMCLPSTPPVIVISTCSGILYHCAVLSKEKQDEEDTLNTSVYGKQYTSLPNVSLFVYESVELELTMMADDEADTDNSCPIILHRDPMVTERYHCTHAAGVHTVLLPWLPKFREFCEQDDSDILLQANTEEHAVVEHLICTQPLASEPAKPILGIGQVTDRTFGLTLIVLTGNLECITLPLRYTYQPPSAKLLSTSPSKTATSPLRKLRKQPFDDHIKKLLQRKVTNPLLRGGGEIGQQECLQILGKATQVFRQEYLQKFETAHQEIMQRVLVLQQQKVQQQQDIKELLDERTELQGNAENLAEKLEEAKENQRLILNRLEKILIAIEQRVPVLSDAERSMQKELKEIKEQIQPLKLAIQQLVQKRDYQKQVVKNIDKRTGASPGFNKQQSTTIRNMLKKEGDEISDLVKKINELKVNLGT